MAEYIDREDAVSVIEAKQKELCPVGRYGRGYVYGSDREKYDNWNEIIDALENLPASDVVTVVRCKECKSREKNYCLFWRMYLPQDYENFFCANGKNRGQ